MVARCQLAFLAERARAGESLASLHHLLEQAPLGRTGRLLGEDVEQLELELTRDLVVEAPMRGCADTRQHLGLLAAAGMDAERAVEKVSHRG